MTDQERAAALADQIEMAIIHTPESPYGPDGEFHRMALPRSGFAVIVTALRAVAAPQCCMCGKKDLSTVEGDGGMECELDDGRWTCSYECWEIATEDKTKSPSAVVSVRERDVIECARALCLIINPSILPSDAEMQALALMDAVDRLDRAGEKDTHEEGSVTLQAGNTGSMLSPAGRALYAAADGILDRAAGKDPAP